jgi:hypothetical protein
VVLFLSLINFGRIRYFFVHDVVGFLLPHFFCPFGLLFICFERSMRFYSAGYKYYVKDSIFPFFLIIIIIVLLDKSALLLGC